VLLKFVLFKPLTLAW